MNYSARTRITPQAKAKPTTWQWVRVIYKFVSWVIDVLVKLPLAILQKVGIIPDTFSINCSLCSLCISDALLGIVSSVGVALGVGLGVGLNCKQSPYSNNNNNNSNSINNLTNTSIIQNNSTILSPLK